MLVFKNSLKFLKQTKNIQEMTYVTNRKRNERKEKRRLNEIFEFRKKFNKELDEKELQQKQEQKVEQKQEQQPSK